ncbi:MAG: SURF1 family protein [Chloroflexi bacterium]|nr:SURF1 family protein [Chloroflexota bacterium]
MLRLFHRRWLLSTLLVIAALGVMVRLGIWQLDRLAARRIYNTRVESQIHEPELVLDAQALQLDLYEMEYRQVQVVGHYLPDAEIVLRNATWQGQVGVELFTPLLIEGSDLAILVERGWIPAEKSANGLRGDFLERGTVIVEGVLRRAETDFNVRLHPDPTLAPDQHRLDAWNNLDLGRIGAQMDVSLLPVYLQRQISGEQSAAPYTKTLSIELSEGPHLGYAGQWFLFAAVLALGYPVYVRRQEESAEVE